MYMFLIKIITVLFAGTLKSLLVNFVCEVFVFVVVVVVVVVVAVVVEKKNKLISTANNCQLRISCF